MLAITLCTATVLVGGVHAAVVGIVVVFAAITFLLQARELRSKGEEQLFLSIPGLALGGLSIAALLQLVPLPDLLHYVLNAEGRELAARGLESAGLDDDLGWRTLSLQPSETADRAARFATLAMIAFVGGNFRERQSWFVVGQIILGVAIFTLMVGAVLDALGLTSFLGGLYVTEVGFRAPSTFVNVNHGAAFCGIAVIIAVSIAICVSHDRPLETTGYWVGALLFAAAAVIHDSDGVLIALGIVGLFAAFLAWWRAGRPTRFTRPTKVAAAVLLTALVVVSFVVGLPAIVGGFVSRLFLEGEHGNRFELAAAGLSMVRDYWVFGGGAGAVSTVVNAHIDWAASVEATIPVLENDSLEILYGFGIFVGGAALLAFLGVFGVASRPAFASRRGVRFAIASCFALYFLLISQLHFPLFALGLSGPFIIWLESLLAPRLDPERQGEHPIYHVAVSIRRARPIAVALAAIAALGLLGHFLVFAHELPDSDDPEAIASYIRQRPADHRVYVRLATRAAKAGDADRALKLANRAAAVNNAPRIRLFEARAMANAGEREAAWASYRELLSARGPDRSVLRAILADYPAPEDRAAVVAPHPEVWVGLLAMSRRLEGPVPAAETALAIVAERPDEPSAYAAAARGYLAMQQPTLARIWAEVLLEQKLEPQERVQGVELLVRALQENEENRRAREMIEKTLAAGDDAPIPELHRLALAMRPEVDLVDEPARRWVERHYGMLCRSPIDPVDVQRCWETEAWLAEVEGEMERARRILDRIARRFDEPMPAARFFYRRMNCPEISDLARNYTEGTARHSMLDALNQQCVKRRDAPLNP